MNKSFLSTIACFALCTSPLAFGAISQSDFSSTANTITFETGNTALPIIPGVSFLYDNTWQLPRGTHWFGGDADFGHYFRVPNPAFGQQLFSNLSGAPGYSDLGIHFDTPVQAVGAWIFTFPQYLTGGLPLGQVEVISRDANGQLLDSQLISLVSNPNAFTQPIFYGTTSSSGISQIEWHIVGDNASGNFFGVDNVTFGSVTAVPEPSILAIFSSGLLALGAMARRRSSKV